MGGRLLAMARTGRVRRLLAESPATRELANRYVAGESIDMLIHTVGDRLSKGLAVSIDPLRVPDPTPAGVAASGAVYLEVLRCLDEHHLSAGVDLLVKIDALGLAEDGPHPVSGMQDLRRICRTADNCGCTVTIDVVPKGDMDRIFSVVQELRMDHPSVGVTVPAMLRRTESDCRELAAQGMRVRLCRGSWRDTAEKSFNKSHEVDLSFVRCLNTLMSSLAHPVVTSHDPRMVEITLDLARRAARPADSYEFQMLLGVRPLEQRRLADIGCIMRTQLPFGPGWYDYFLRRVAMRPSGVMDHLRSLLSPR